MHKSKIIVMIRFKKGIISDRSKIPLEYYPYIYREKGRPSDKARQCMHLLYADT